MKINKKDNLITVDMKANVNGKLLTGYVFVPMDVYKVNKDDIDALSVRIDGTSLDDCINSAIEIIPVKLENLFKYGFFFLQNELFSDILEDLADQTDIDYDFIKNFNEFIIDEVNQVFNSEPKTIVLEKELMVNELILPKGTKLTYEKPMPEELNFEFK